jgi:putative heme-binding domain-containing protein
MWARGVVLAFGLTVLGSAAEIPQQAGRGKALFAEKKCSNCHKLGDNGTAVGPDLTTIARLSPKAIRVMLTATRTAYVVSVKQKGGSVFPAMKVSDDGTKFYDLSQDPPAIQTLEKSQIAAITDNEKWMHPATVAKLEDSQIADLVAFIKFASFGDKKGVSPDDVK